MLDVQTEEELFKLDVGTVSRQFSTSAQTTWYKVIGKEASRPLDDAQVGLGVMHPHGLEERVKGPDGLGPREDARHEATQ